MGLFVDNCLLYQKISSYQDQLINYCTQERLQISANYEERTVTSVAKKEGFHIHLKMAPPNCYSIQILGHHDFLLPKLNSAC